MALPQSILFILSTSRTGTRTLAEGLHGGEVVARHQPPYSRPLTIAGNFHLHGWLPLPALAWLVARWRAPQIRQAGGRYYVQAFSLDYLPAKILAGQWPQMRLVHIVRDPRTFVPSYLNWIGSRWQSRVANSLVPGWHPSGYWTGAFSWSQWRRMDRFQRVCWHWSFKNRLLEEWFGQDERYLRLKFEDLFGPGGEAVLRRMLAHAGIPFQPHYAGILRQPKNQSRRGHFPSWEALDPGRREQLLALCGTLMQHYNYLEGGRRKDEG